MQKEMVATVKSCRKNHTILICRGLLLTCILFFCLLFLTQILCAKSSTYIPPPPSGTSFGFKGIEYDYVIVTMNQNSSWLFDWGDGHNTSWLQLSEGESEISQTHRWDAEGTYELKTKFRSDNEIDGVWSDPLLVTIAGFTINELPNPPEFISGKIQGSRGTAYPFSVTSSDPQDYLVCYRFDWGDGTFSDWTRLSTSGSSIVSSHVWYDSGTYMVKAQAKNQYGLESRWSDSVELTIDNQVDGTQDSVDFLVLGGTTHFIVFSSNGNITFQNTTSGMTSPVLPQGNSAYLIDDTLDGQWDCIYIPALGLIEDYETQEFGQTNILSQLPWSLLLIGLGVICCIVVTILILVKSGFIYLYEEDVTEE